MIEYIIQKGKDLRKNNQDNIYTVLSDWLVLWQQTGFGRKEWAQDRTYFRKYKDIQRNINSSSAAFMMEDFGFRFNVHERINNSSTTKVNKDSIANIKWRFQKNLDNGQVLSYVKDTQNKQHCALEVSKTIRKRAIKLKIPKDKSIAVYMEYKKGNKKSLYRWYPYKNNPARSS